MRKKQIETLQSSFHFLRIKSIQKFPLLPSCGFYQCTYLVSNGLKHAEIKTCELAHDISTNCPVENCIMYYSI